MRKRHQKARPRTRAQWEAAAVKHARARLGERYGIHISELEYWELVGRIRMAWMPDNLARLLAAQSRDRHLYDLCVRGQWVIALWSPPEQRIATFLPRQEGLACNGLAREAAD
jgi:hypothetical protein